MNMVHGKKYTGTVITTWEKKILIERNLLWGGGGERRKKKRKNRKTIVPLRIPAGSEFQKKNKQTKEDQTS